jgi:hypothetical protein
MREHSSFTTLKRQYSEYNIEVNSLPQLCILQFRCGEMFSNLYPCTQIDNISTPSSLTLVRHAYTVFLKGED